ncbi:MAG: hypothetical protein ABI203_01725 [Mucilaginibacter sp.]
MPFVCQYQLNNGAIESDDKIIFKRYLDESFGKYHEEPIKIAEALLNGKAAFVYSSSPGFPSTKGNLIEGDVITPDTIIGYFAANGEDIPYSRPYATIGD